MWFNGAFKTSIKLWSSSFVHGGSNVGMSSSLPFVRYMSRTRAENVRKINPKVPIQEAYAISNSLYDLIKQRGPLTIANTWVQAQEAGVSGINSKTHMKILLKWMRGRKMLKLFCNQVGSNKKFLHCTLPEDPQTEKSPEREYQPVKHSAKAKKMKRKMMKKAKQLAR